jgi:hypothetical protein
MRYMFILIGEEGDQQDQMSPEQMQEVMDMWSKYSQDLSEAGAYVAGEGLQPSPTATTLKVEGPGEHVVTDGPYAETKEQVGGFYVIECENLDEALEWARKVPLQAGGSIEVRPVMDFSEYGYEEPATASAGS